MVDKILPMSGFEPRISGVDLKQQFYQLSHNHWPWHDFFLLSDDSKILVHCSAGVGRTGTFMGLYKLMTKIDAGLCSRKIDVFNEVFRLRQDRCLMVTLLSLPMSRSAVAQSVERLNVLQRCISTAYWRGFESRERPSFLLIRRVLELRNNSSTVICCRYKWIVWEVAKNRCCQSRCCGGSSLD